MNSLEDLTQNTNYQIIRYKRENRYDIDEAINVIQKLVSLIKEQQVGYNTIES